jgi:hypothetical protein
LSESFRRCSASSIAARRCSSISRSAIMAREASYQKSRPSNPLIAAPERPDISLIHAIRNSPQAASGGFRPGERVLASDVRPIAQHSLLSADGSVGIVLRSQAENTGQKCDG